jgi:hypothetical protein
MTDGTTEKRAEIPDEWMDRILGAVRVTVNAAIMDYHNIRVSRLVTVDCEGHGMNHEDTKGIDL